MKILDACCGSRMFWFDKQNENTTFMDIREYHEELTTGHIIDVAPDVVADYLEIARSAIYARVKKHDKFMIADGQITKKSTNESVISK